MMGCLTTDTPQIRAEEIRAVGLTVALVVTRLLSGEKEALVKRPTDRIELPQRSES